MTGGDAPTRQIPYEELRGGPLARMAALLTAEPAFRTYLEERHDAPSLTAAETRTAVCRLCGPPGRPLVGRKMLDHDDDAAARFTDLRADFIAWRFGQ